MSLAPRLLASVVAAGLLAGCSLFSEEKPPLPCPPIEPVGEAMELTRFAGAGRDLTDVAFRARLADVRYSCEYRDGDSVVETDLLVLLAAQRGPANQDGRARFGYFVAIATAGDDPKILARQEYRVEAAFEGNRTRAATGEQVVPRIPLAAGTTGSDYRIYVGLLLSPEELQYNRDNRQ